MNRNSDLLYRSGLVAQVALYSTSKVPYGFARRWNDQASLDQLGALCNSDLLRSELSFRKSLIKAPGQW